jgi:hypothetical protein
MFLLPALTQNYRSFIPTIDEVANQFKDRNQKVDVVNSTANINKLELVTTEIEPNGVIFETKGSIKNKILTSLSQRKASSNRTKVIQVSKESMVKEYEDALESLGIPFDKNGEDDKHGVRVMLWQDAQGRTFDETYIDFRDESSMGRDNITSEIDGFNMYFNSAMYTAITRGRFFALIGYGDNEITLNKDDKLSKNIDNSSEEINFNKGLFNLNLSDLDSNLNRLITGSVKTAPTKTTVPNKTVTSEPIVDVVETDSTLQEDNTITDVSDSTLDDMEESNEEEAVTIDEDTETKVTTEENATQQKEQEKLAEVLTDKKKGNTESFTISLHYPESNELIGRVKLADELGDKKANQFNDGDDVVVV